MNEDTDKLFSQRHAEQAVTQEEHARVRINALQETAAELFAESLVLAREKNRQDLFFLAQERYFSSFATIVPVTVEAVDRGIEAVDPDRQHLIIIANHPPMEKTVSPTADLLLRALRARGRNDIIPTLQNITNLPAGIARRGIIRATLSTILPNTLFRYHVVGARYRPPLHVVQKRDGTIIVPYVDKEEKSGYGMLLEGMAHTMNQHPPDTTTKHAIVTFPEGMQPQTIEVLRPFHSGIFSAIHELRTASYPIVILPLVMAMRADFSAVTRVLPPITSEHPLSFLPAQQAATQLQTLFQDTYSDMLQSSLGGQYYWRGMKYPFGGLSRNQILGTSQPIQ
jgi:hypothetical protein